MTIFNAAKAKENVKRFQQETEEGDRIVNQSNLEASLFAIQNRSLAGANECYLHRLGSSINFVNRKLSDLGFDVSEQKDNVTGAARLYVSWQE